MASEQGRMAAVLPIGGMWAPGFSEQVTPPVRSQRSTPLPGPEDSADRAGFRGTFGSQDPHCVQAVHRTRLPTLSLGQMVPTLPLVLHVLIYTMKGSHNIYMMKGSHNIYTMKGSKVLSTLVFYFVS